MPKIRQSELSWCSDRMPTPSAREIYTRLVINTEDESYQPELNPSLLSTPRLPSAECKKADPHTPRLPKSPRLQKADVLKWFRQSEEEEVAWVLNRLVETDPHVVFAALSDKISSRNQVQHTRVSTRSEVKPRRNRKHHTGVCVPGHPILQFTSAMYYAEEGVDEVMLLDVMRIGNQDCVSEVCYETEDDSALSGRSYRATSGKLVFQPGETLKQIEVPIIDNPLWDTTTQFKCRLKEEGLRDAVLGMYLHETRVHVIDSNHFPSDDFKDLFTEDDVANYNKWRLLRGYLRLVSNIPTVWSGSVKFILVDVFHNLWYLFELFMSVYILDYIVDTSSPTDDLFLVADRWQSLIICSILTMMGRGLSHMLDYARVGFTVVSPARNFLQQALLRKFLNYTNVARERLPPGKVMIGMELDIVELVSHGYLNMLVTFRTLGKFICMLCFKLLCPIVFGGNFEWHAFLLLLIIPLVLTIFLQCREDTTSKSLHHRNMCHNEFAKQISLTTTNYRLVLDYGLLNHCEHKFIEKQQQFTAAARKVLQVSENNMQFCKWCRALLIALWLLYGGIHVIHGSLSLGLFTTNLRLYVAFGNSTLQLYSIAIGMMNIFPALENITTLMNYPIDAQQRKNLRKHQQLEARAHQDEISERLEKIGIGGVPIDMMPILLNFNVPFKFEGKDRKLNFIGRVTIHQGQLVAVAGPQGCGKATLLRLIAGSVLPSEENAALPIFVPLHLRVANVADAPLFFGGTLYDNLTYGMDQSKPDASRERVRSICKLLNLSAVITDYLDVDDQDAWEDIFSGAQRKLLSIARALTHNAELLCIHKPFSSLMEKDAELLVHAFHKHVEHKGLSLAGDSRKRRPRTVIWSAGTEKATHDAHNILQLDVVDGIKLLWEDLRC